MSKSLLITIEVLADGDWHSPNSLSPQVGGVRNLNFFLFCMDYK